MVEECARERGCGSLAAVGVGVAELREALVEIFRAGSDSLLFPTREGTCAACVFLALSRRRQCKQHGPTMKIGIECFEIALRLCAQ